MNIILNGKTKEFPDTSGLDTVIAQFCRNKAPVIAELNGEIVKPPRWATTALNDGDVVELVSFVGGG